MNVPYLRLLLIACSIPASIGCQPGDVTAGDTPGAHAKSAAEYERGPHRGRLLRDGDFALELQVFEEGVPPEFHVYVYRNDKPIPPDAAQVGVELDRLDGEVNRFAFAPQGDFLRGDATVNEPHSFAVSVVANEGAAAHHWQFDSFEGRTTIDSDVAHAAGVRSESAGAATIEDSLRLTGRLVPDAERVRGVSARFPGLIRTVEHSVGDTVKAGESLATIESNESLETYSVKAPIGGVVTQRHANPGETTGAESLFVIADYSSLWAELALFPRDIERVKVGQVVTVSVLDSDLAADGRIVQIAPVAAADGRSLAGVYVARVSIDNRDRRFTPGLFVEGRVHIGAVEVPLAVKRSALQGFRDFTVVFAQVGDTYEVRMLELGRQDREWIEVLEGLRPGTEYVTQNSYLIKADIEKSGASHDH